MSATTNAVTRGKVSRHGIASVTPGIFWWGEWMVAERGRQAIIIHDENPAPKCYADDGGSIGKLLGTCEPASINKQGRELYKQINSRAHLEVGSTLLIKLHERWSFHKEQCVRRLMREGVSAQRAEHSANEQHPKVKLLSLLARAGMMPDRAKMLIEILQEKERQRFTRGIITRRGVREPLSGKYWWAEWMPQYCGTRVTVIRSESGSNVGAKVAATDKTCYALSLGTCELIEAAVAA